MHPPVFFSSLRSQCRDAIRTSSESDDAGDSAGSVLRRLCQRGPAPRNSGCDCQNLICKAGYVHIHAYTDMIPMNTYKYMHIRTMFVQFLPHALAGSSPQLSVHDAHASRGRVAIRTIALPLHILVPQFGYLTRHVLEPVCSSIRQYMSVFAQYMNVSMQYMSVSICIYAVCASISRYGSTCPYVGESLGRAGSSAPSRCTTWNVGCISRNALGTETLFPG